MSIKNLPNRRNTIPEKVFLKNFILNQFNAGFRERLRQEDFDIRSINPKENFKLGYEILPNLNTNIKIRLIAYLNINRRDFLGPFYLKLKENKFSGDLEDEVFVVNGEIDSAHHLYGGYPFRPLSLEPANVKSLLTVDRLPFLLVDGGMILLS